MLKTLAAGGCAVTDTEGSGQPSRAVAAAVDRSHVVVAVVVECRGRIALLRRSRETNHDKGRWHCVTGFVEPGTSPSEQALVELEEETGLGVREIDRLAVGPVLRLTDGRGQTWLVHTFRASTSRRRLRLNWEHSAYTWVSPSEARTFRDRVVWLTDILDATHP